MGPKKKRRVAVVKQLRRLGVWRKRGSVYVTLSGEPIRDRPKALSASVQDEAWLASIGGGLGCPPLPVPGSVQISDWGLPQSVSNGLSRMGIRSLYDWQEQCIREILSAPDLGSVVYSAPTSGGKSLVADLILIRRLLYEGKRALIVCPFVSICKERTNFLRCILQPCGVTVEEFHGPVGKPWHPGVDVAVCTVQKGLSILHRIIGNEMNDDDEDNAVSGNECSQTSSDNPIKDFSKYIGTVVVDEFHLTCEQRGSVMESFVSRLGLLSDRHEVLLIGMSATLPDNSQKAVQDWLGGHTMPGRRCLLYKCNFRPIELSILVKRGKNIIPITGDNGATLPREIRTLFDVRTDTDHFASLVNESLEAGVSTIIFCATRNWCENACTLLSRLLGKDDVNLFPQRIEIIEALRLLTPSGIHPVLSACLLHGIAFHHAGLTSEERTVIETGFRSRAILILCATSTLSAGVNLPAERVILRTLTAASGGNQQSATSAKVIGAKVKQMVGRAGRAGHAARGEAIIMCSNEKEERTVREIFLGNNNCSQTQEFALSLCAEDPKWVGKEILETISFMGKTKIEFFLRNFARAKLLLPAETVRDAIQFLIKNKLVNMTDSSLMPTVIGDALAHSSLPTDEAETVFRELNAARQKLCLGADDLHLLFLVTPPVSVSESEFDEFSANSDMFLSKDVRAILGSGDADTPARKKRMMVALMLRDLTCTNETLSSIPAVAKRYGVQSGTVQYLQSSAATYCAMVSSFCERLQWTSLAAALTSVKPRLHFGVPDELLPLVEVEGISPARARALARAGFTTVKKIAKSKPIDIAVILARRADSSETAQRLLDFTSSTIINNARIKLGWSPLPPTSTPGSDVSYGLFPSISPPVLLQLLGTQREEDEYDRTLDQENDGDHDSIAATLSQRTLDEDLDFFEPPLVEDDEDELLADALRLIDTAPPRRRNRRISEMTTVDGRREFDIPSNNTAATFEDGGLDSLILRSIDFNQI